VNLASFRLDNGQRKLHQDAEYNADQAEFRALQYRYSNVESGIEDDNIADSLDDYTLEQSRDEEWAMNDVAKDNAAGLLLEKLQSRAQKLGDSYPFELNGAEIKLKENQTNLVYRFCLAVANAPNITKGKYSHLPREFEQLAGQVVSSVFGSSTKWLHTGWPRPEGQPTKFKDLAEKINQETGGHEWIFNPAPGFGEQDARKIKDCGVDFISWNDFFDTRDGKLYVAGQCACGNDWVNKFGDINFKKLERWFRPTSLVTPVKVLSIPFCATESYLFSSSDEDNILMDRTRLTLLHSKHEIQLRNTEVLEDLVAMVKDN